VKTGTVDAACTMATMKALSLSEVISHAETTSFIHIVKLAASHASHSMRKTGWRSGAKVDGAVSVSFGNCVFSLGGSVEGQVQLAADQKFADAVQPHSSGILCAEYKAAPPAYAASNPIVFRNTDSVK
jgi:hypothetical protein